ncbi:MAG: hypothetical protein HQL76_15160 [Magnetococcales bacterium]|nr:hypothetical protein [Magnetococcales bacterium]
MTRLALVDDVRGKGMSGGGLASGQTGGEHEDRVYRAEEMIDNDGGLSPGG